MLTTLKSIGEFTKHEYGCGEKRRLNIMGILRMEKVLG